MSMQIECDVVRGTAGGGRVTKWSMVCSACQGLNGEYGGPMIPPTTRQVANRALVDHMAAHREGRIR